MENNQIAPVTENILVASDIGSDADFAAHLAKQQVEANLEARERQETSSVRRADLMREGFHAGHEAAASDYVNGTANVECFEGMREERDITDFYAMGFELGYLRKLAEILVA